MFTANPRRPWRLTLASALLAAATLLSACGGGGDVIKAMASGGVQIGEAGSSPFTAAASQGQDLKLFWILDDIGDAVRWMADQKIGHAHIKVTPNDLGTVEIRLRLDGDRVHADFSSAQAEVLFDAGDTKRQEQALAWAKEQGVRYALGGSVDEWRYKVGVDGEPAAGLTLQIIDVQSGEILWSGAGGKSGWSREALSAVAQKLIRELLNAGLSGTR